MSEKKRINPQYLYKIDKCSGDDFKDMCSRLVALSKALPYRIIRMVFFGNPTSQEEYLEHFSIIKECIDNSFGDQKPVYCYVSQSPLSGDLVLETTRVSLDDSMILNYKSIADIDYITLEYNNDKVVYVGGVRGASIITQPIREQCKDIFWKVNKILTSEGMDASNIVRQWNYVERITDFDGEHQHYQSLNDVRTLFYNTATWNNGFPAATGIGTAFGGVIVDFDAISSDFLEVVALDNDLQVPAHAYSQGVLLGEEDIELQERSTPKFERGKIVASGREALGYISGTAAIRGEESLTDMDIMRQTVVTMENIEYLMSVKNLTKNGVKSELKRPIFRTLRVYLKYSKDIDVVKPFFEEKYPQSHVCYVIADVCREELLIEVEGVATY